LNGGGSRIWEGGLPQVLEDETPLVGSRDKTPKKKSVDFVPPEADDL